jgi:cytochrome c biogenesis protein CcmG/thiol:disulfide interchange protein DsbE
MNNHYWATIFVSLFLLTISGGPVLANEGGDELMPEFSLPTVSDGTIISSDDFKGKVLLVNFFATWCPPCIKEIPILVDLQKSYEGKDFSVIGFSVDKEENKQLLKKLMAKTGVNYPVVLTDQNFKKEFGAGFLPVSFLIDRDGMKVKSYFGERKKSVFEKDINELLK